jgi:hypothetical protein
MFYMYDLLMQYIPIVGFVGLLHKLISQSSGFNFNKLN